ncbi:MAG: TerB family tellurite resistance protein [Candidatus Limisoma sp.]|nr:TerB family tellurite resistance protein [Bacteroidales bacterium]
MKVTMDDFAALLAAAIWADGVYAEAETITLEEIADAFELNADDLKAAVEGELEIIKDFDDAKMQEYISHAGAGVEREESMLVFEAIMQLLLSDGVLCREEVRNLLVAASVLDIDTDDVVLLVADMIASEPEMTVTLE